MLESKQRQTSEIAVLDPTHAATSERAVRPSAIAVSPVVVIVLLIASVLVRRPYLDLLPRFTDETLEVIHSLGIARGEQWPLTNYDSYYGALFNYLIAAPLALLGPDPLIPRTVVMLLCALTVLPTYLLGAQLGGRLSGILAAALVAFSSAHIAVNSHIAWSNCLTPLFTTTGFWLLARSFARSSGGALVLAGLSFGLALQTHPAAVAFAPAIGWFVLARCLPRVRWPWLGLAGLAFALGYGNMVAYNLATDFDSLRSAQRISAEYAHADDADAGLQAVTAMLLLAARLVGGAVDQRSGALAYLLDPGVLLGAAFAGVGLTLLTRKGAPLLLLSVIVYLALLPLVNTKFQTLVTIRYLMPLYPLLAVGTAAAATALAWRLAADSARLRAVVIGLALIALLTPQMISLQRHYDRLLRTGDTNERILRLASVIENGRRDGEPVIVDEGMGSELPGTGVTEVRGFRYLLTMANIPHQSQRINVRRLEDELLAAPSVLAVINARDAEQVERRLNLLSLEGRPRAAIGRASDYQVYRVER